MKKFDRASVDKEVELETQTEQDVRGVLIGRNARIAKRAKKNGVEFIREHFHRARRERNAFTKKLIGAPIKLHKFNLSACRPDSGANCFDRFRRHLLADAIAWNDRDSCGRAPLAHLFYRHKIPPKTRFGKLRQPLFANGQFFYQIETRFEADSWTAWNANRSLFGYRNFRLDYIFLPVALARGNVAGQRKIRKRRQRNIVSAANSGFQHTAAPYGDIVRLAEVVDAACRSEAAYTAEFDVDDATGAKPNGGYGLLFGVNTFVEANGCDQPAL